MLSAIALFSSLFVYTPTTITFYECVTDQADSNRVIRSIEAGNGYKIVIYGVRCNEA